MREPLERGRALILNGTSHWVTFKYEKLPMLCFDCGRILHGAKGCPFTPDYRMNKTKKEKEWGIWLRTGSGWRQNSNATHNREETEGWWNTPEDDAHHGGWKGQEKQPSKESSRIPGKPK